MATMCIRLIAAILIGVVGLPSAALSGQFSPSAHGTAVTSAVIELQQTDDTSLVSALPRLLRNTEESSIAELVRSRPHWQTLWMKFTAVGNNPEIHDFVLRFENTYVSTVDMWLLVRGTLLGPWRTGRHLGNDKRSILTPLTAVPMLLHQGDTAIVIVRMAGRGVGLISGIPVIQYRSTLDNDNSRSMLYNGLFFGLMFALLIYNLFIYISTREQAYLAYVVSIAAGATWLSAFEGLPCVLMPTSLAQYTTMVAFAGAAFGSFGHTWFVSKLLNVNQVAPTLNRVVVWFYRFALLYAVVLVLYPYYPATLGVNGLGLIGAILLGTVGIVAYRRKVRAAKYFLIAHGVLILSLAYWTMANQQLLPNLFDGFMALRIGNAFELLTLSLVLGDRMNAMRAEKEIAERGALEAELYRVRNVELEEANNRSNRLLLNVLPEPIAERMKAGEQHIAEAYENVAVVFADIAQFTVWSAKLTAAQTVNYLDMVFSTLDELTERHGLEKIKTIGDCYMVVCGVPDPKTDPCAAAARYALELRDLIAGFDPIPLSDNAPLQMRIGMDYGHVVAGVIGKKKFSFDLWGDVVNTAARMESHGKPGEILCTSRVEEELRGRFVLDEQPMAEIKGKGLISTFILRSEIH